MSTELAKTQDAPAALWDRAKVDLLKRTVTKGATDDEFELFASLAKRYDLDPIAKEIFCAVYEGGKGRSVLIMTSRDGYLKICQRDPDFLGIASMAVHENDEFEIDAASGSVHHRFGKGARGKIIGAWAMAKHRLRDPAITWAEFSEYNKAGGTWAQYPSAMICKVAETMALKRQGGISGLTTREEMGHDEPEEAPIDADFRPSSTPLPAQTSEARQPAPKARPATPEDPALVDAKLDYGNALRDAGWVPGGPRKAAELKPILLAAGIDKLETIADYVAAAEAVRDHAA